MTRDDLERLLRGWGVAFGEGPADAEPLGATVHPLARAMEFAPGKKDKRRATHRAGFARRKVIGEAAGLVTTDGRGQVAPAWAVDPVRGSQTRGARGGWSPSVETDRVERSWAILYSFDRLQAICMRVEYCRRGSQAEKAAIAAEILGQSLKLRRYRLELDFGRAWMRGCLSISAAA